MSKVLIIALFTLAAAITFSAAGTKNPVDLPTTGVVYEIDIPNITENEVTGAIASYLHLNYKNAFYSLYWREGYNILYGFLSMEAEYVSQIYIDDKVMNVIQEKDEFCNWFPDYVDNIVTLAGINSTDDAVTKVEKLANVIINNYNYNNNRCQAIHESHGMGYMDIMRSYHFTFCATDAMLMCACCDKVGVECKYVEGTTSGIDTHAWNSVYVDDRWRYVDISYARANSKNRSSYILFWANRIVFFEA